ncbi:MULTISPECIES: hypothetical protein [unclassified Nocardiopsis]|uniref:hypothetical protein n=1 Tax=unclassified Nocardiopsis TaxID=2649073 RepID=UPI001359EA14|nr:MULTISPECIES: hypothetical protein [unclassified Nocardiopsis]
MAPLRAAAGRWAVRLLPWAAGLLAGVLALGPALGRGYVLRYDMVFVPDLPLGTVLRGADGFPRAIPSDAVVALLSTVLPGDVVQALALLAVFTLGGAGAARLAARALGGAGARGCAGASEREGPPAVLAASVAAGVAYVWNPFVAERLLLGQWAVLLGYAGLPWVVGAAARLAAVRPAAGAAGLVRALVPAAVGGFSSVVLSALTAGPVALLRPRSRVPGGPGAPRWWTRALLFALALVVVSLPWLLPSLVSGADTDPAGVAAFAARADTPFGALGSLVLLGGVWNSGAVPAGYGEPVTAAVRLALCLAALAGWVWWLRRERPEVGPGLSAAALGGLGIALLGTTESGRALLTWLITAWPGFGPLRDGQLYVAPLALVQALGLAVLVRGLADTRVARPGAEAAREPSGGLWRMGLAVLVALLPVVVLPGLLWGAAGRLVPVSYPAEWRTAQAEVAADDVPGAVLVLPWSAYRGPDWSGSPVVVLDPATRLFDRRTLWNDDLRVGTPDGGAVVVAGEDARSREAARVLSPDPATGLPERLDAAELGAMGVRHVAVSAPVDNPFWFGVEGLSVVVKGADMVLLRVSDQHVKANKADIPGLEVTSGLVTVGAIIWSMARSGSSLVFQRFGPSAGPGARKEIPK